METPTPFDLNAAIPRWQQDLSKSPAFKADTLEELATHLRASVQKLKAEGRSEEEAFLTATQRIGEREPLEQEFAKLSPARNWSLPLVSFWIVASIYFFQVVDSLICRFFCFSEILVMRDNQRLFDAGAINQLHRAFPSYFFNIMDPPTWSLLLCLVFIFGARLAAGSWKGIGAFIKIFKHPILAVLGLVVLDHVAIPFLPATISSFNAAWPWNYLMGMHVVNDALVLIMVLLARRALRKISMAGDTPHKCTISNSR